MLGTIFALVMQVIIVALVLCVCGGMLSFVFGIGDKDDNNLYKGL